VTSITGERFSFDQIFGYDWDIPIDISDPQFIGKETFCFLIPEFCTGWRLSYSKEKLLNLKESDASCRKAVHLRLRLSASGGCLGLNNPP
jgi:hypothetical protein